MRNPEKPALALKPVIDRERAQSIVTEIGRHRNTDPSFIRKARFDQATLYFCPLYDIAGTKADFRRHPRQISPPTKPEKSPWETGFHALEFFSVFRQKNQCQDKTVFSSSSFQFYAPANPFLLQRMPNLDLLCLENAILKAEQLPFDPLSMRRQGVLLGPDLPPPIAALAEEEKTGLIESQIRVLYFPIWEISFSHNGLVYKNYVDAIEGTPLLVQTLHDSFSNRLYSMLGLLAFALILAGTLRQASNGSLLFMLLTLGFSGLFYLMADFLWDLFSGNNMLEILPALQGLQIRKIREIPLRMIIAGLFRRPT